MEAVSYTHLLYEVETAAGEAALNEIRAELKSQGYLKYYKQRDKRQKQMCIRDRISTGALQKRKPTPSSLA